MRKINALTTRSQKFKIFFFCAGAFDFLKTKVDASCCDAKLIEWFKTKELNGDYYALVRESQCAKSDVREEIAEELENIGFDVIANTFTQDGAGPTASSFKKDMAGYGLNELTAHKIFLYMKKVCETIDGSIKIASLDTPDVDSA